VFNNAPGGGGNDWALDDISVATCSPNLAFTPTNSPSVCEGNTVDFGAWIRSYFNNYVYYRWQTSSDNGVTWVNSGGVQTGVPVWNGTMYEYFTAYPTFVANNSDSGMKYRVVVASTLSNITSTSCAFADAASILTLTVIDCGDPLSTDLISFNGKLDQGRVLLNWATNREEQPLEFTVERSADGNRFYSVATMPGRLDGSDVNYYNWSEEATSQGNYYRVRMTYPNRQKISRIVKLGEEMNKLQFVQVPNPFHATLVAEIQAPAAQKLHLQLVDNLGHVVSRQQYTLHAGLNVLEMETERLPKGMYTLQVITGNGIISKKLVKI
jgi:hypothetical protein